MLLSPLQVYTLYCYTLHILFSTRSCLLFPRRMRRSGMQEIPCFKNTVDIEMKGCLYFQPRSRKHIAKRPYLCIPFFRFSRIIKYLLRLNYIFLSDTGLVKGSMQHIIWAKIRV